MDLDKDKLVEQANIYIAGDSGVEHDEVDFWLWRNENRRNGVDFVLELIGGTFTCADSEDLWHMNPARAKECKVIDITLGYCPDCPFVGKCEKTMDVEKINSSADGEE